MGIGSRRLLYLSKTLSQAEISRQTGIPQSTLSYVQRGIRPLPRHYELPVRNTFQRVSYTNLRAEGSPSHQARRYSWYTPEKVADVQDILNTKRNYLIKGYIGVKLKSWEKPPTQKEIADIRGKAEKAILKGLQDSRESMETIIDY